MRRLPVPQRSAATSPLRSAFTAQPNQRSAAKTSDMRRHRSAVQSTEYLNWEMRRSYSIVLIHASGDNYRARRQRDLRSGDGHVQNSCGACGFDRRIFARRNIPRWSRERIEDSRSAGAGRLCRRPGGVRPARALGWASTPMDTATICRASRITVDIEQRCPDRGPVAGRCTSGSPLGPRDRVGTSIRPRQDRVAGHRAR